MQTRWRDVTAEKRNFRQGWAGNPPHYYIWQIDLDAYGQAGKT
jgi:hypothetical protein